MEKRAVIDPNVTPGSGKAAGEKCAAEQLPSLVSRLGDTQTASEAAAIDDTLERLAVPAAK